jgi:hypothetical protein
MPTLGALAAPLVHQFIGSHIATPRTDKSIGPAARLQIALAGLFAGEIGLKLAKRLGK